MRLRWIVCALVMTACGGGASDADPVSVAGHDETSGDEARHERDDGVQITGLMGTIPREQVEDTLNPRMTRFRRCFEQRLDAVEFLGGDIRLAFRISTEGNVLWVYPSVSSIGDRVTEQCVLDVARAVRFPRPRGGEAEFAWGFGFDAPDDVRPPLSWEADALGRRLGDVPQLARECSARGHAITVYIEPGGRVLSAGGSAPSAEAEPVLDCLVERVRSWTMPDPGSYPAKVTFSVE